MYEIAKHYFDLRKYQRAAQIYQQLADQWPESTYVLDWQKGAVMCYFYLENDTAAQTALDKLKANFSENPQLAAVLCDIALNYRRAKKFPIADQLYQYVLENQPEGEHEVWLQQGLAITNIMLGREEAAQTAIDILLQDFSDYQYIPNIIQDIAYHYYQAEKYDRAVQYNQHVVEHWPESDYALWCQVGLVNSQVKLGKNSEAQEALNKLLTDYAERADIAQAVQEVTKHYHVEGNKDKAQELSQYIVDHWPESDPAAEYRSQMESTIVSNINLGNDEEVQAAIDELIAASGNPLPLSDTMIRLGEAYYTNGRLAQSKHQEEEAKENFIKAIGVWERIINELPAAAAYTPRMYFMCAVVYAQELQQYAKGIDYFREVTVDWPEFEAACDCYYQMGRYYYPWRDEGGISPEEAEQLTEAAYGQVVAKYPACWLSGSAAIYLGHKFFHQGQWEKAAEYLEFYLGTDGPERQAATAMLGEAFQKLDMPGLTEELYRDYLQAADPNDAWAEEFQKRLQDLGVKP
jgi:tetratricopeptide (TPR) repeat protein